MPDYTTPEQIEEMQNALARERERIRCGAPRCSRRALISRIAFGALAALLIACLASVYVTKSRGEVPNVFGLYLFSIESGSMEPTLGIGAVILSRAPRDAAALNEGDIVTFRTTSGDIVTHRIIAVNRHSAAVSYTTKGDNPVSSPDPEPLTPERVIALFVLRIPLT
ncbi:MAG TPA: signal peptidase I [Papillibacter sp.]|jgi:signal peptidase|nr:signal peptidase I [Papillibacter sp.]